MYDLLQYGRVELQCYSFLGLRRILSFKAWALHPYEMGPHNMCLRDFWLRLRTEMFLALLGIEPACRDNCSLAK